MRRIFDDRVKEWFPLKYGNFSVKLENHKDADDYDRAKSLNTMPSHFGSFLSHSKKLMDDFIKRIDGFYKNSKNYTDSDSLYTHKRYWSSLVDNGFVDKSLW